MKKEPTTEEQDIFWAFVDVAQWNSDKDYRRIRETFNNISRENQEIISDTYDYFHYMLNSNFENAWLGRDGGKGIDVSDDGWSDLRAEVIGRGKGFYNSITVEVLQEMADNLDYTESFGYSFI